MRRFELPQGEGGLANGGLSNGGVKKRQVNYRECRKNQAASIGGYALDGCGEFMPSDAEGTSGAMTCAACHCHRNFHRKEVDNEASLCEYHRSTR
ncbi:hypothetical protein SUGI_1065720 [Cryptomeria japonica]|nr:hypothetical protein SUGI_1065720 [Cryptomeria japonica]